MTRQRYNKTESLNRILRSLKGSAVPQDTPNTVSGEILSEDESLSDLAELLAGSLPGETFSIPGTISNALRASVAQVIEGLSEDVFVTPLSHRGGHHYGGIYTATGTSSLLIAADVWTQATGTFQHSMPLSGAEILGDWENDQILMTEDGTYFVFYQMSFLNHGVAAAVQMKVYVDDDDVPATQSYAKLSASGSAGSSAVLSAGAMVTIAGVSNPVDLRITSDAQTIIAPKTAQLVIHRVSN